MPGAFLGEPGMRAASGLRIELICIGRPAGAVWSAGTARPMPSDASRRRGEFHFVNRATTGPVRRVRDFTFGRITGAQRPRSDNAVHSGVRCRFSVAIM